MRIVKTKSFELAIIEAGDPNSGKLAILIPGRLDTKDYAQNVSHINFLATKGYYAISFDPPGTWDSPGSIKLYTTTNTIEAINELIELFGNRPTLLMGHSRGGTIAHLIGPKNDSVTHMVSVNSGPGGRTMVDRAEPGEDTISYRDLPPGTTRTAENLRRRFDLPYSYFEDADKYDAVDGLARCTKPKLFFYGTEDTITPFEEVNMLYTKASEPKTLHPLKTEHDYRLHPEIIEEVNKELAEFIAS